MGSVTAMGEAEVGQARQAFEALRERIGRGLVPPTPEGLAILNAKTNADALRIFDEHRRATGLRASWPTLDRK
jgi:hypothetical protein